MSFSYRFILACVLFLLQSSAFAQGQNLKTVLQFSQKEMPLTAFFSEIENQTDLTFAYQARLLPAGYAVSLSKQKLTLKTALEEGLPPELTYRIVGRHIVLTPEKKKKNSATRKPAKKQVSGYVHDAFGQPLARASLSLVGQNTTYLTDSAGYFSFHFTPKNTLKGLLCRKEDYIDSLVLAPLPDSLRITLYTTREPLPLLAPPPPAFPVEEVAWASWLVPERMQALATRQDAGETKVPVQLSFVPGIGTQFKFSGLKTNILSLNLLAGYSRGLRGIEIGGLLNITRRRAAGIQLSGVANLVGEDVQGLQVAGVVNQSRYRVSGLQLGGALNLGRTVRGIQLGGLGNVAKDTLKGAQVGGVFNYAKCNKGIQIGLINFSEAGRGFSLGLLNFPKGGVKEIDVALNSFMGGVLTVRLGASRLYNLYRLYYRPDGFWGYAAGLGSQWAFAQRSGGFLELTAHRMLNPSSLDAGAWYQAYSGLYLQRGEKLSLRLGPSFGLYQLEKSLNPPSDRFFALRTWQTNKHLFRWNLGGQVSLGVRF